MSALLPLRPKSRQDASCGNCHYAQPFTPLPDRGAQDAEKTRVCGYHFLNVMVDFYCLRWVRQDLTVRK